MLVYVATPVQFNHAFMQWIDERPVDERRIVHQVYQWFMKSAQAREYNTVSGLTCFSLDCWVLSFRRWIDQEIAAHPANRADIQKWSDMLVQLLSSHWGIKNKLIVKECLLDRALAD